MDFDIILVVIKTFEQQGATNSTEGEQSQRELSFQHHTSHILSVLILHTDYMGVGLFFKKRKKTKEYADFYVEF